MFGMSDDKLRVFMAAIIGTYRVALDPKAVIIPRKIIKKYSFMSSYRADA